MIARVKQFTNQNEQNDDMTLMIIKIPARPALCET
jgi:serine phosphatase RsbU (regulator of sigma subunit)